MTEEIIIDGVNVAECCYKDGVICRLNLPCGMECCDNPNCYYKQLKRLEQENKELKEEKQTIKSYLGIDSKTILERLEELDEWKHNDKLLLWKYSSALEEIKSIITLAYKVEDYLLGQNYTDLVDRIDKELEVLDDECRE